jgi:hypothetical protein
MSATLKQQDIDQEERARLELRKTVIDQMAKELSAERRRLENSLRAMTGLGPIPDAAEVQKQVPIVESERKTPEGKMGNGATTILGILAEDLADRKRAAAEAEAAQEAKKILPPWHGTTAPKPKNQTPQQVAAEAGAEALARITAEMAAMLMELVSKVAGWMRKPPPFALDPTHEPRPGAHPTSAPNWEF